MANRNSIDKLHNQMPKVYKTKVNPNFKALIEAIGQNDQLLMDLIIEIRDQLFVSTASRPYLDRLGANVKVSRPRLTGMDDPTFRRYIPVMAYQPKQVKLILDTLLDVFFYKEATTAFIESSEYDFFFIKDGWELNYTVDGSLSEQIIFSVNDFVDISNATAEEVVSAINRKAKYSFAIVFDNRVLRRKYIRIFTRTVGVKGSLIISGGRANFSFKFPGWISTAGTGPGTIWQIDKIGDEMIFKHIGGDDPHIENIVAGDIAILDIPNNTGAFFIENVDLANASFSFRNQLGVAGIFNHGLVPDSFIRFQRPEKSIVYTMERRAITWEVKPGEIIIEMPATPPVVRRQLKGSAHLNGMISTMLTRESDSSMTLIDIEEWPQQGKFVIQEMGKLIHHNVTDFEDTISEYTFNGRFSKETQYTYSGRTDNTLTGISPDLPVLADTYEVDIISFSRTVDHVLEVVLAEPVDIPVGYRVRLRETVLSSGTVSPNGNHEVIEVVSPTVLRFRQAGDACAGTGGVLSEEHTGLSESGSLVYLTTSQIGTGILGPYIWDPNAAFVLSSIIASLGSPIFTGDNLRTIQIDPSNSVPNEEGYVIFDYGTTSQEGPVRYFSKPNQSTLQIDPSYTFIHNHETSSAITVIRRRGAHVLSGLGTEFGFYVTDPSVARDILKEQIEKVKSVGIFLNFLIRYPQQLYATLDVYRSGDEDLWPVAQDSS